MLAYVKSDVGLVRETNEDSYEFLPPHLFVVADGMGGHAAGEIASNIAVQTLKEYVTQNILPNTDPTAILKQAIIKANSLVYDMALSRSEYTGMGTTLTAVYLTDTQIYWGHVGDSRIYLFRNNELCQMTHDHSLVWELVQNGSITKEEANTHPQRNMLTRAVGTSSDIKIDVGVTAWNHGDIVLLCTDGLTNMVSEQDISTLLNIHPLTNSVDDMLIEQAKRAGGLDNITVILVRNGD
ncbi:Protein phosphatase PrpC [bioreactor metagenome]|uniref:Protein phosphatase PrpC n=1 Tax=bioreactor metagenome TaxID=1076179 RepID=A0A644T0S4_9ZZZZ|nr:Stp1/IreP family PP2C-type Ser/Thr phosphatase [Negativicutes bacterium]